MAGLPATASPDDVTGALAAAKAEQVASTLHPPVSSDCVVIGCDSMLYIDGKLCGKPPTVDEARNRWRGMAGNSGQLHTGHSLIRLRNNEITHQITETAVTTVRFGRPDDDDLEAYLASGEPLRVAIEERKAPEKVVVKSETPVPVVRRQTEKRPGLRRTDILDRGDVVIVPSPTGGAVSDAEGDAVVVPSPVCVTSSSGEAACN